MDDKKDAPIPYSFTRSTGFSRFMGVVIEGFEEEIMVLLTKFEDKRSKGYLNS